MDPRQEAPALAAAAAACARALQVAPAFSPTVDVALEPLGELGRGGMGVVRRVRDRRLGREAALKQALDPALGARLAREARVTAGLDHPGIPPVYEAGVDAAGRPFLLMRVVEGRTLAAAIADLHAAGPRGRGAARAQARLLEAVARAGEAVAYAHARGVVHRDLKPANIMLGGFGEVLVMDWGAARVLGATDSLAPGAPGASGASGGAAAPGATQAGAVVGTLGYLPPEQANGEEVDARADVFALGAILVEVLTGRPPVEGETPVNRLAATVQGRIARPRDRRPDVPADLDGVAARALAPDRDRRTRSADAFVAELRAWLAGEPVPGHAYGPLDRLARAVRAAPLLATATAAVVVVAALAGALGAGALRARASSEAAAARADLEAARAAEAAAAREAAEARARLAAEARAAADARAGAAADRDAATTALLARLAEVERLRADGAPDDAVATAVERLVGSAAGADGCALALLALRERPAPATAVIARLLAGLEARAAALGGEWLVLLGGLQTSVGGGEWAPALERLLEGGDPRAPAARWARALRANVQGAPDEALAELERARADGALSPRLLAEGARARAARGDLDGARRLLEEALVDAPGLALLHTNLGFVLVRLRQWEAAEAALTRAIALDARAAGAFLNRGVARHAARRDGALEDLARAVELGNPQARRARAQALLELGQAPERAAADLTAHLEAWPDDVDARLERGLARERAGDAAGAAADWREVLARAPDHPRAAWLREQLARLGAADR